MKHPRILSVVQMVLSAALLLAGQPARAAVPATVVNPAEPAQGLQRLQLEELWRAGGEDGEILFGQIVDVDADDQGNVYVLDNQLCRAVVFSPAGEYLRTLSREGEGPGEVRQPTELIFLPEETLGIVMGFPGKIILLKQDGTPAGTLYPNGDPQGGGFGVIRGAQYEDGLLAADCARIDFGEAGTGVQVRFLTLGGPEDRQPLRLAEKSVPLRVAERKYVEAEDYFPTGRWALGPDRLLYAAADRDRYLISVFAEDGRLVRTIERAFTPRRRTQAEKDRVGSDMQVVVQGERVQFDRTVEDNDEAVRRLLCRRDGTLWVLTPQGAVDQPAGILETWDVFDREGRFVRQVAVPLGDEMQRGTIFFLDPDRLVAVKGTGSDDGSPAGDGDEEAATEPLEVICYRIL